MATPSPIRSCATPKAYRSPRRSRISSTARCGRTCLTLGSTRRDAIRRMARPASSATRQLPPLLLPPQAAAPAGGDRGRHTRDRKRHHPHVGRSDSQRGELKCVSHVSDLCETFRSQSGLVWNRMAKASRVGLALSEETLITETALYEMALAHELDGKIAISLATKPQEARHGADWEWWLINGNMGVSFRVQAKRLFPNGSYQSLLKAPPD